MTHQVAIDFIFLISLGRVLSVLMETKLKIPVMIAPPDGSNKQQWNASLS
jgi:hypothetical protein